MLNRDSLVMIAVAFAATLIAGCGQSGGDLTTGGPPAAAVNPAYLLSERPADAQPVALARKDAADGGEVAIEGRIGGGVDPWVEGRAAFTIVDLKLKPCQPGEGCPTPWDYCCSTDELPENRAMVKFVDASGGTVEQDAKSLLGVKELQTVVVKGTAKRDEAGNLTILASGIFIVPDQP